MRDAAFLAFLVAFLPVILRFPHAGAMVWAWLAFFSPDQDMYGFMTNLPVSKVVAILTVLSMAINPGRKRLYLDGIILLMGAFVLQGALSAAMSPSLIYLNWDIFGKLTKIVALALVLTMLLTNRRRLQGVIIAVVLGLDINGVLEALKFLISGGAHRVLGLVTLGDNNQLALALLMSLPMIFYLQSTSTNFLARWALRGTLALCVIAIIGSYSRGGFIGLVVAAVALVLLNRNRGRNLAIMAVAGLLVVQLAPSAWFDRINTIRDAQEGQDSSFNSRILAWKVSAAIARDRPFYGAGFHGLQDPHVWSTYAAELPDDESGFLNVNTDYARAAHSIYFEVLGDTGYTGLLIFVSLIVAGVMGCLQIMRMTRGRPELRWAGQFASMMLISLSVYATAGAALSMAYFELFYLQLAMVSVTRRLVRRELDRRRAVSHAYARISLPWEEREAAQIT